jgi:hypothetical protein
VRFTRIDQKHRGRTGDLGFLQCPQHLDCHGWRKHGARVIVIGDQDREFATVEIDIIAVEA